MMIEHKITITRVGTSFGLHLGERSSKVQQPRDSLLLITCSARHPSFARHLAKIANIKPGDKILDLACGPGLVTFSAATTAGEKGHATAVDVSAGMLKQVRAKQVAQAHTNVEFYQHDMTRLDTLDALNNASFNVLSLASALSYLTILMLPLISGPPF